MSHASVQDKVKLRLWVAAGGRCEYPGCNKALYRDDLTLADMNRSNVAHIIADKPGGPRGDEILSPQLAGEFSNLMLMCYDHHHLIDHEGLDEHPVEVLCTMKAEHERRIETVTGIDHERKTEILIYTAKVGHHNPRISYPEAATAVLTNGHYPASYHPLELGRSNSLVTDTEDRFWADEEEHLRSVMQQRLLPRLENGSIQDLSVFARAPQPLLTLLGYLLCDINHRVRVYQLHREPPGWSWQDYPAGFEYVVEEPDGAKRRPALVFALSATVTNDRVFAALGDDAAIWRITIPEPHNDFLKSARQLRQFRELIRQMLDKIKARHGQGTPLCVFPAAPVAIAVELGRVLQPKADMPLRLYDQNNDRGGFVHALDINLADRGTP
jgi:hypothetical protein